MTWITYSLIAAAATAAIGIIDKIVLDKWMNEPAGSFFIFSIVEAVSGAIVFTALGWPLLPPAPALAAGLAGAAFAASIVFYFRAIKVEEVSRVVPLYGLTPVLVAVLAAVFLKETLPPAKYLGIALLVWGAILISLKRLRGLKFGRGLAPMLLAVALTAGGVVASKFALNSTDPWTAFAYSKIGTLLITPFFAVAGWRSIIASVRRHGGRVLLGSGLSETLTAATTVFFLYAAATGPIALVNALVGVHPFFLLLFTVLLSLYRPAILKEELGGGLLLRKIAALACLALGGWLIT